MNSLTINAAIGFAPHPGPRAALHRSRHDVSAHIHRDDANDRWSQLMASAQRGDGRAYNQLLREIVPYIRAIALRQHRARDRADEVVQDVLLTLHRVRHTYDPARPFRRWLTAITRRRSIDALRCRYRAMGFEIAADSVGVAYETYADPATHRLEEAHASADHLGKAITGLPTLQREAIELLRLRELSLAEASKLTGRSVEALKVNVHRALKSLQKQLRAS